MRYMTESKVHRHAEECARAINEFWREQGLDPEARAERGTTHINSSSRILWPIESNMVNGFPAKSWRGEGG